MVSANLGGEKLVSVDSHPLLTARTPAQAILQFRLLGVDQEHGCPGSAAHLVGMFSQRCDRQFEGLKPGQTFRDIYQLALQQPPVSPGSRHSLVLLGVAQQLVHQVTGLPLLG